VRKKVPSDTEIGAYADQLYWLFGLDDDVVTANIFEAALYVRDSAIEALNPFVLWNFLHPECGGLVPIRNDDDEKFPLSRHIERLFECYSIAARETLRLDVDERTPDRLWRLGAFGRSIRPFTNSNTITFLLLENRCRLNLGLPWEHRCKPKEKFDHYFEFVFKTNFAWAFAP
jgi:hypothetical protein